jgi:hypothetical protein
VQIIAADQVREPLHCIVPYFNPWRFKTRVKHAQRALKHFADSGAVITFVEVGFNRRDLVFADSGLNGSLASCPIAGEQRHRYIGLHTKDELWLKENMVNVGVQSLPYDWQQVAWLDADVHFCRPNWVGECIHKLQHGSSRDIAFLQMFSQAQDLGPNYEILKYGDTPSFAHAYLNGTLQSAQHAPYYYGKLPGQKAAAAWPGLAWACTRKAWDAVGGLWDIPVVDGGADHDMARALIERADGYSRTGAHPNFRKMLSEWEDRCRWNVRRNVLVMEGAILHHWHGPKRDRQYLEKYRLTAGAFDPLRHIKRDSQGLYQLADDGSENFIKFRDGVRQLAALRREDSIDL